MNRELAESFVVYGIKATDFRKNKCAILVPINIFILAMALIGFHETYFIILTASIMSASVVAAIIVYKLWSAFTGLLSQAIQFIFLSLSSDCLCYAMYQYNNIFVWQDFIVTAILQIVVFGICIIVVVITAEHHKKDKVSASNAATRKLVASIAGLSYITTTIILKYFFTDISDNIVLSAFSVIVNVMVFLLSYVSVMAFYRAHLIRKFKLTINLDGISKNE